MHSVSCSSHLLDNIVVVDITLAPMEAAGSVVYQRSARWCRNAAPCLVLSTCQQPLLTCLVEDMAPASPPVQFLEHRLPHLLAARHKKCYK